MRTSPKTGQRLVAAIAWLVALGLSMLSGPLSFAALPATALAFGWPTARYVFLPARRRFIAEQASGLPSQVSSSAAITIGAVLGVALVAVLRLFGDEFAFGFLAQYFSGLGGGFFIVSLAERH